MALMPPHTTDLLKHLIGNFVLAAVLFAAAIGIGAGEKWCEAQHMPDYLQWGTRIVGFVLFSFDAILICGTAVIVTLKHLKRTWDEN